MRSARNLAAVVSRITKTSREFACKRLRSGSARFYRLRGHMPCSLRGRLGQNSRLRRCMDVLPGQQQTEEKMNFITRAMAALALGAALASPAQAADPIRLGLVDELTGPQAEAGS